MTVGGVALRPAGGGAGGRRVIVVEKPAYRLEVAATATRWLLSARGERLALPAPARGARPRRRGRRDARDLDAARSTATIVVERRSTVWERAGDDDRLRGRLDRAAQLGQGHGRVDRRPPARRPLARRPGADRLPLDGPSLRTLFSPNPGDPGKLVRAARGGGGDRRHRRRRARPRPLVLHAGAALLALARDPDGANGSGSASSRRSSELRSSSSSTAPATGLPPRARVRGAHAGDGEFDGAGDRADARRPRPGDGPPRGTATTSPPAMRAARRDARAAGLVERADLLRLGRAVRLAKEAAVPRRRRSRRRRTTTRSSSALEQNGVVPGTVVIDDKWQATLRRQRARRGEVARPRAAGSRRGTRAASSVLLWWKAWDPEGLPRRALRPHARRRTCRGSTRAIPPRREILAAVVARLLGPHGLDADGLKVDFTARTPSGRRSSRAGRAGGSRSCTSCCASSTTRRRRQSPTRS